VLVEPFRTDTFIGGHGWTIQIDRVSAVGITYRAKLISPDGRMFQCPTQFRKSASCYKWAKAQLRRLCTWCKGSGKQTVAGDSGGAGGSLCSRCEGSGFR
jgi:hypothetical protein